MGAIIILVAGIFIIASIIDSDRKKKREACAKLDALNRLNKKLDEFVDKLVESGKISREERNRVLGGKG